MSMSSARGSAAGFSIPEGKTGCTIVGSTGMHMRLAPTAADVRLNAEMSGYTMAFPVPGMYAQMQSNMASTLNIDWLLDMARDMLKREGVERARGDLLKGMDERIMARPAGAPSLSSLYLASRRARALPRASGARAVHRPRDRPWVLPT